MKTTVLMTMFRLTVIPLHFASKQYAWRIHLQENIMAVATYMPEVLKHTFTSSGQLPTICESFFFPFRNLGQLAGPTGDATFIHAANFIPRVCVCVCVYTFQIQHVNYQNI